MILNPVRAYRRWRRAQEEALDEAHMLRRRHGEAALDAARAKLSREDLSSWGRRVLQETVRVLEKA